MKPLVDLVQVLVFNKTYPPSYRAAGVPAAMIPVSPLISTYILKGVYQGQYLKKNSQDFFSRI
jgi:hypothetical protein